MLARSVHVAAWSSVRSSWVVVLRSSWVGMKVSVIEVGGLGRFDDMCRKVSEVSELGKLS